MSALSLRFQTARPWGVSGQTPEAAWSKREPISAELRQQFIQTVAVYLKEEEQKVRSKHGYLPGIDLEPTVASAISRAAVRRALQAHRLLDIRRREFTLPFSS